MRRSQFDNGSQPVRNLFANPGCETASGLNNVLVRTNLCTHPGVEAVGGVSTNLRTNLATNPRGVLTLPDYSGATAQTITPNIAITNHPEGITTANRVEYAANATNPGVAVLNPAEASTTYTLSAWVYHETAPASHGGQAFAQAGIASQPTPPAITQGQWTRVSWTTTTGASPSYFGFRVASPTTAGAFLITGILIEKAPELAPFFDGATTIRNLCANPSVETNGTGWGFYAGSAGTATSARTTGVGFRGTAYWRGTWTVSQTGVNLGGGYTDAPIIAGHPYSASIAVRTSKAQKMRMQIEWLDAAKVILSRSGYTEYDTTPGEWRELKLENQAAPASAAYARYTAYSAPLGVAWLAGDTLDLDACTIVYGTTAGPYEETTDATYAWTGTTNASTSQQRGITCPSYVGANQCIVHRVGSGTGYAARVLFTGNTLTDSGLAAGLTFSGITPSRTYTVSMDVTTDRDRSVRISIQGAGVPANTSSTFTQLAGTKTRRSHTFTTNATAGAGSVAIYLLRNDLLMGTIDIDNVLIEEGAATQPYFDGSTPAAGDFNYAWQGTANASTSIMRGNGVATFAGGSGGGTAFIQSSDWAASGTKSCRIIPGPNASADTYQNVPPGYTLPPGTYTIMATLRLPAAQTGTLDSASRARRIVAYHSNTSIMSPQAPNTPGVYPLRVTFKVTDGTVYQSFRLYNGAAFGGGDVWWDNIMLVEGDYQGGYIDPSQNLLAKWEGTANASKSVGYPPQLLDIAGVPTLDQIGPGNSATIAVDGFAARTLYAVYEVTDINAGSWQVPFAYGPAPSTDGFTLQSNAAGQSSMAPRADFATGGGQANASLVITGRTAGRVHVVAFAFPQGLTGVTANTDGGGDVTRTYTPGTVGWPNHRAAISNPAGGMKGLRGLVYMGEHDRATRIAISRYLGNKYGAAVA